MSRRRYELVLSIYLTTRGLAFTLFEGPLSPVDWGATDMRGLLKNRRCRKIVQALLSKYRPDALVLQDVSDRGARRAERIRTLNLEIAALAEDFGVPVASFSRAQVRDRFSGMGATTKQHMAEAIAKHIPVFERYVPPQRKPWMSEDKRMALFDAAALAMTLFQNSTGPPGT